MPELPVGIKIIDNLITNSDEIIEYLDQQPQWKRSRVIEEVSISPKRTSETLFIPMLSWTNEKIIHEMNKKVWEEFDSYAKEYEFSFSLIEDVSIQRYQVGDYYSAHVDSSRDAPRVASAVLYLNTIESGGETRFTHFNFSVTPIAGRLVLFPANYAYQHEALPPKKGIKIAAAYWARQ